MVDQYLFFPVARRGVMPIHTWRQPGCGEDSGGFWVHGQQVNEADALVKGDGAYVTG